MDTYRKYKSQQRNEKSRDCSSAKELLFNYFYMFLIKCLRVGHRSVPIVLVEYWKVSHWNIKKLLKKIAEN